MISQKNQSGTYCVKEIISLTCNKGVERVSGLHERDEQLHVIVDQTLPVEDHVSLRPGDHEDEVLGDDRIVARFPRGVVQVHCYFFRNL